MVMEVKRELKQNWPKHSAGLRTSVGVCVYIYICPAVGIAGETKVTET